MFSEKKLKIDVTERER